MIWTLGVVFLQNVIGFLVALLLNQNLPGQGVLRALILLPWVLPGVVAAILWRFMYDPQLGLINSFLFRLGIIDQPVPWLADPSLAMAAVIFVAFWKGFPFSTVIYLAALQNVDQEQVDAARVDGAGRLRRLLDVVIPAILPVAAVNVLLTTILTFNYFDIIYVLTRGGPLNATVIFPTRIYEVGFGQFRFGEASAYGALSVVVLILIVTFLMLFRLPRACGGKPMTRRSPSAARPCSCFRSSWRPWCCCRSSGCSASRSSRATEPFAIPAELWPREPTLDNYILALRPEFQRYFLNSVIVSCSTLLITIPLALLAAYSLARFQFWLLSIFLGLVVLAQFFPAGAIIIPIYKIVRAAGLLDTYASLIIAYITVTLPVAIWMMRGFLMRVPKTLEEAAAIDGAKPLRAFIDIVVPLAKPGIIATSVWVLIVTWQEFLFALSFTSSKEMRTYRSA